MNLFDFFGRKKPESGYTNKPLDFSQEPLDIQGGMNMTLLRSPISFDSQPQQMMNGYNMSVLAAPLAAPLLQMNQPQTSARLGMTSGVGGAAGRAEGMMNSMSKTEASPMLSQVQQMGRQYQRKFKGMLG